MFGLHHTGHELLRTAVSVTSFKLKYLSNYRMECHEISIVAQQMNSDFGD